MVILLMVWSESGCLHIPKRSLTAPFPDLFSQNHHKFLYLFHNIFLSDLHDEYPLRPTTIPTSGMKLTAVALGFIAATVVLASPTNPVLKSVPAPLAVDFPNNGTEACFKKGRKLTPVLIA